jgi:hypothetical protein
LCKNHAGNERSGLIQRHPPAPLSPKSEGRRNLVGFLRPADVVNEHRGLKLGETVMAPPAISDGVLYIRGLEHVFAVGAKPLKN